MTPTACATKRHGQLLPKHIVPRDFVAFLRARTYVPASYAATAAVAIIRAGLSGQFALERAQAAMLVCALRALHFHTPQSMMSIRGIPIARDRCHFCSTWVVSRWGISDAHGDVARTLVDEYADDRTKSGTKRPPPFDKRRDSMHSDVVRIVTERVAHLTHAERILVCWACAVPVVTQIHASEAAHARVPRRDPQLAPKGAIHHVPAPARPGRALDQPPNQIAPRMTPRRAFEIASSASSNTAP